MKYTNHKKKENVTIFAVKLTNQKIAETVTIFVMKTTKKVGIFAVKFTD